MKLGIDHHLRKDWFRSRQRKGGELATLQSVSLPIDKIGKYNTIFRIEVLLIPELC